jgi:hypothetical protein
LTDLFRYAFKYRVSGGGALIRLSRWTSFAVYTFEIVYGNRIYSIDRMMNTSHKPDWKSAQKMKVSTGLAITSIAK